MYTGGHGIAWDGPFNPELRRLIEDAYKQRKLIAAVDHGPAALVHAINRREEDPDYGTPILARKQVQIRPPALHETGYVEDARSTAALIIGL